MKRALLLGPHSRYSKSLTRCSPTCFGKIRLNHCLCLGLYKTPSIAVLGFGPTKEVLLSYWNSKLLDVDMKGLDWAILPEFVVITVSEAVQVILLVLLNLKDLWALSIVKWTLSLSCASPNIGWSFSAGVIIVICIFQKFFREVVLVFLFLSLCMKHNFIQFASFMFLRFRFTSLIIIIWRWLRTKWWSWWWAWWGCPWVTWTFPLAPLMLLLWLLFLLWFWISYILLTWRVVLVVWKTLIRRFPFPLILIFGATLASNFLILTILAQV